MIVTAQGGQTVIDLAIQYLGGFEDAFEIIDANSWIALDMSIPAGTEVRLPDRLRNKAIVEYFSENDIAPVSGLGEDSVITQDDMNNVPQELNYGLAGGGRSFDRVKLFFLRDLLSVQISYSDISTSTVVVAVEQSLDGDSWSQVPYCSYVLDPTTDTHTFNIMGVLTNYVRLKVTVPDATTGTIDKVIWKT